jgi:hypothetical protein
MIDDPNKRANVEPEFITIVEGPEPAFMPHNDTWVLSVLEGAKFIGLEQCRLRTFDGPGMVERCRNAWTEGRPVFLDYPNRLGLRRQVLVAAARWGEIQEGMLLYLWVRTRESPEEGDE